MTAVSVADAAPPACPAGLAATAAFCLERWRLDVDEARWASTLRRRERVVRGLRDAGDPRAADAVGWLSLAGALAGFPARLIGAILGHGDPAALVDEVAVAATGGFAAFSAQPDGPPRRHVTPDGLEVIDAGSRNGWTIADLVGRSSGGAVVAVGGRPMTPTGFRRLLRERVTVALDSTASRS